MGFIISVWFVIVAMLVLLVGTIVFAVSRGTTERPPAPEELT